MFSLLVPGAISILYLTLRSIALLLCSCRPKTARFPPRVVCICRFLCAHVFPDHVWLHCKLRQQWRGDSLLCIGDSLGGIDLLYSIGAKDADLAVFVGDDTSLYGKASMVVVLMNFLWAINSELG